MGVCGSSSMKIFILLISLLFANASNETTACNDGKIRGVNAGGWLLLEPWITPKLFEEANVGENLDKIVDEYTYAQFLDPEFYKGRLKLHWDSFVRKEDFEKVASAGVTHVRIPVGYWYWDVEDGEPFPSPNIDETDDQSPLFYLKRALVWLDELNMKAEIDLHAGPGSQNGFDNSGRRGDIGWVTEEYPEENHNVVRTLNIVDKIAENMKRWIDQGAFRQETLYGISLLNEPGGWWDKVWSACKDELYPLGYDVIRKYFEEGVVVNLQQAFRPASDYYGFMPEEDGYKDISVDMHRYQCFGDYWSAIADMPESWWTHLDASCAGYVENINATWPTFTGEFSLAVTDCQKYLTGGYRTPYDPQASDTACQYYNSNWSTYSDQYKKFLQQYFLAQIDSYEYGENGAGWFMWTMKTENNCAPEWDFLFLLENQVIPSNLCERETFCSF